MPDAATVSAASPDDLRDAGWSVAIHNDYWLGTERWTFWLVTKDSRCAKGEGRTDADALGEVRRAIKAMEGADA